MSTFCPGCNKPLRRKQLVSCHFVQTVHDDGSIANKVRSGQGAEHAQKEKKRMSDLGVVKDRGGGEEALFECASCSKSLTNSTKCACLSRCGHVVCLECVRQFVAKHKVCAACDEPCKKKHVIILKRGGTGFAAHGHQMEVTKKSLAFQ